MEDNRAGVCVGSSGRPFALVVCVRIDEERHAVFMPAFVHPDSVDTYLNFLKNGEEVLRISNAVYEADKDQWLVHPEPVETHWPKNDDW